MPYDNVITRTDLDALIPEEVSRDIIKNVEDTGWIFRLARRLPNLSSKVRRAPVLNSIAYAYFVNGDMGLKQTTELDWTNKYIEAEEIAVIAPIPEAALDDSDYDIWGEVRPELEAAFQAAICGAVLFGATPFGQAIPASWTANMGSAGLVAGATAAGQLVSIAGFADLYEAVLGESADGAADGLLSLLEADGFLATGHVAATSMRARYRNVRDASGLPIFQRSMQERTQWELDGSPIFFPTDGTWDAGEALQISGEWRQLVYAMRQDMTYKILDQAVITDAQGRVVFNLAQQDMVALRAVMRLGFALPNPKKRINMTDATRYPFAVLTA